MEFEISEGWPPGQAHIDVKPQTLYWPMFQFHCPTPCSFLMYLTNISFYVNSLTVFYGFKQALGYVLHKDLPKLCIH